jgi:hypothetical protein
VHATSNIERLQADYLGEIEDLLEEDGIDLKWEPLTFEITAFEKLEDV